MRDLLVPRWITILALLGVSVVIVAVTVWMAGRSYENLEPVPFEDLKLLANRLGTRPLSTRILAVIVVPIVGNVLLFVPWGFLMFLALYTVERPTAQTYVLTTLLGLSFTLGIEAWQYFLPSRVADINDVIWNSLGAILGAILGHMRMRVRFEFE